MTDHPFKIGDIIYNSWGWEQTNIDFYQIVGITKKSIKIRRIHQRTEETGIMCGITTPMKDFFLDEDVVIKYPKRYCAESDWYVNFDYGIGIRYKGDPVSCSWYG